MYDVCIAVTYRDLEMTSPSLCICCLRGACFVWKHNCPLGNYWPLCHMINESMTSELNIRHLLHATCRLVCVQLYMALISMKHCITNVNLGYIKLCTANLCQESRHFSWWNSSLGCNYHAQTHKAVDCSTSYSESLVLKEMLILWTSVV